MLTIKDSYAHIEDGQLKMMKLECDWYEDWSKEKIQLSYTPPLIVLSYNPDTDEITSDVVIGGRAVHREVPTQLNTESISLTYVRIKPNRTTYPYSKLNFESQDPNAIVANENGARGLVRDFIKIESDERNGVKVSLDKESFIQWIMNARPEDANGHNF